ncbi:MAG: PHP domain-containing protein, partial [Sphingobium sp.]
MGNPQTRYVELQVTSHFSFLRGASSPEELFAAGALLGHRALGLVDRGSVAGVVRGWDGQKTTGCRMIPGARIDTREGHALLAYPTNRAAWSQLTRLLSIGKARGGKGLCLLDLADIAAHAEGMIGILLPDRPDAVTAAQLDDMRRVLGMRGYAALSFRRRPDDVARLHLLDDMIRTSG